MAAEHKFIIPKDGVNIRDPLSKEIIPKEGLYVPWTGPHGRFWRRRENDGSITVYDEKPIIEKKEEVKHDKKYNIGGKLNDNI